MTEYKIVEKAAFTVIGKKRRFSMESSYMEIPKFWQEHMSDSGIVIGDPRQEVPEGYETRQIPAPKALRDVNSRLWNEWLPNCTEYRLGGNYDIEMYTAPTEDPAKTYSEIWMGFIWNAGHFHLSYLRFLSYHRVVSRIRQGYQCE